MELRELIKEVQEFLESLGEEKLSEKAEAVRLSLLSRLANSHSPPPAYYLTMSKTHPISSSPDKVWNEGSYEVMEGPPPVYSNSMPDVLSSSKRISRTDLISTASSQGVGKGGDCPRKSVVAVQSGALWLRKRRRPGFIPWSRVVEYWASLAHTTLHLHPADRRSKPALQVDLTGYSARSAFQKNGQHAFEIYSPGKKTYQFVASTEEEVQSWIKAVCEGCTEDRLLPSPPGAEPPNSTHPGLDLEGEGPYEHYDVPDSRLRPVQSHYTSISYPNSPVQEHVYKNVDDLSCLDNTYYNIVSPGKAVRCEQIYQTISENKREVSSTGVMDLSPESSASPPSTREPSPVNPPLVSDIEVAINKRGSQRMSGGRVQQIVKSLEAQDTKEFEPVDIGRVDLHRLSR